LTWPRRAESTPYLRGFAPGPDYETATVKMPSKNIGRNGHKHICAADSAFVDGPV